MSSYTNVQNRLWVQVIPLCELQRPAVQAKALPEAIITNLVASGVGAIIQSAVDKLATDQYVIKTVIAYEPGFVIRANASSASFLLNCVTLNVGPQPIPILDKHTRLPLPLDVITNKEEYEQSPVVIRLEFTESSDRTAVAARITHWKYSNFIDSSTSPLRKPGRKISVEIKISDVESGLLLATAMQVEGDRAKLSDFRPNHGERLPWMKRPMKNFSGDRIQTQDQEFGPLNIEVTITEVAESSRLGMILAAVLGNQKTAIEAFVKDHVNRAINETEAAKAKLGSLKEAATALENYKNAYKEAITAKGTFDAASDPIAKRLAKQALTLQLATLDQKEILARTLFDSAQLSFEPMEPII